MCQCCLLVLSLPSVQIAMSGKYSREFFTRQGELRHIRRLKFWPIERVLIEKYDFPPPEATSMASFLVPLLDFAPERRATAREALQHPWLTFTALPKILSPAHPVSGLPSVPQADSLPDAKPPGTSSKHSLKESHIRRTCSAQVVDDLSPTPDGGKTQAVAKALKSGTDGRKGGGKSGKERKGKDKHHAVEKDHGGDTRFEEEKDEANGDSNTCRGGVEVCH